MKDGRTTQIGVYRLALILLIIGGPFMAYGEVPQQINYQGYLTKATGGPVTDGDYAMVFSIYDDSETLLWTESQTVKVTNGIFNIQIGQDPIGNPFPANLFLEDCYLGVKVGADNEMTPKQLLTSVFYALNADLIDGLDSADLISTSGGWMAGDLIIDGNLGIGGASPPSEKLEVEGNISAENNGGRLVLRTLNHNHPDRYGIKFDNNSLGLFLGDDTEDQYYGFYSEFGKIRDYSAHLRVFGKAANSWGTFMELTHDGTDGLIETDIGNILLSPASNVGIGTLDPTEKLEVVGNFELSGLGHGVIFPDGSKQTTAVTSGDGTPPGYSIMGDTETPPPGYTYTGHYIEAQGAVWNMKANMPTERKDAGAASCFGKIYVIGGRTEDENYIDTNEEYDPATDTWAVRAPMPTAREKPAIIAGLGVPGTRIYAIGGWEGSVSNKNEEYDPITNTWRTRAPMPTARIAHAAANVLGRIYIVGGNEVWLGDESSAKNESYNPATDGWITLPPMPTPRRNLAVAAVGQSLYAIGGYTLRFPTGRYAKTEEFNIFTNSWTTKSDILTPRSDMGAVAIGNAIYVLGGRTGSSSNSSWSAKNEAYYPMSNHWEAKEDMSTARGQLAVTALGNKIYVIGGALGGSPVQYSAMNEEFRTDLKYYIHKKN